MSNMTREQIWRKTKLGDSVRIGDQFPFILNTEAKLKAFRKGGPEALIHYLAAMGNDAQLKADERNFKSRRSNEPRRANDYQHGGDHYNKMKIQPWDFLKSCLTPEEYRGWQKGVAIVYLAREREKAGDLDVRKAIHHLEKLMEDESKIKSGDTFTIVGSKGVHRAR